MDPLTHGLRYGGGRLPVAGGDPYRAPVQLDRLRFRAAFLREQSLTDELTAVHEEIDKEIRRRVQATLEREDDVALQEVLTILKAKGYTITEPEGADHSTDAD